MLKPTSGTFPIVKFFRRLTATAQVDFDPTGPTTGKFENGQLTTTSEVVIKVPKVTASFWGLKLPLGGGPNCQTSEPVTITASTPEGETFQLLAGGSVTGTYDR